MSQSAQKDRQDDLLWQRYLEADRELRVRAAKLTAGLGSVLVAAGVSLDYFGYPDLFWSILPARALCVVALSVTYLLLLADPDRTQVRVLSFVVVIAPTLAISWMIYISEGSSSPFYAGLNLVIIGACLLLYLTFREAVLHCSVILASYVVACLVHTDTPFDASLFSLYLIFLAMTAVLGSAACHFGTLRRISDFTLRHELNVRNQQLEELDRLKSQFFAGVSHELRTPLTLILAPVDGLLNREPPLENRTIKALRTVRQNGLRLLRLINDLLEVVRLEEGRLELARQPVRLDRFVPELAESVRGLATGKGLELAVDAPRDPVVVMGDPVRLEKVLLNLLSNAVKFTPPDGRVSVRCARCDGRAVVEVADSGVGIAEEDLPYIFDRFRQVGASASRQHQGLGLGLALAKELVEEHHGELTATSRVGEGTTFTISLPVLDKADEADMLAENGDAPEARDTFELFRQADRADLVGERPDDDLSDAGSGSSTVLVVDDESDMRSFLVTTLAEVYTVRQAADGRRGLEAAQQHRPDLVLLDLMLPEMNGLEVTKALRDGPDTRDVKILMLTAKMDDRTKIEALSAGVNDFVTKPFSTIEVKTRIRNLLAAAALEDDLRQRNVELRETLDRLRATEAQLVQSEKMNALGSLAAGLLHEMNNPLNHTMMAVGVARMSARPDDKELAETLDDIEAGMQRLSDIISDLRSFAYPEQMDVQSPFNIREALKTSLRFTARELEGVRIETDGLGADWVVASQTHVTQVLVNLLVNASHAVRPVCAERGPEIRIASETDGDRLRVHVRDNGVGIDADKLSRIFDPFFSTREVGEGIGLGLSICHTIVKNHGGTMAARSEKGHWTELTFDLPLWDEGKETCPPNTTTRSTPSFTSTTSRRH